VSNFLTNPAKDFLEAFKRNNKPPFKIKYRERPTLESLTRGKRDLLELHRLLRVHLRTEREVSHAESELWDRVWHYRHMIWMQKVREGRDNTSRGIIAMARAAAKKKRKEYGPDISRIMSDFEWGYMQGKFSALRWVLGSEWD